MVENEADGKREFSQYSSLADTNQRNLKRDDDKSGSYVVVKQFSGNFSKKMKSSGLDLDAVCDDSGGKGSSKKAENRSSGKKRKTRGNFISNDEVRQPQKNDCDAQKTQKGKYLRENQRIKIKTLSQAM